MDPVLYGLIAAACCVVVWILIPDSAKAKVGLGSANTGPDLLNDVKAFFSGVEEKALSSAPVRSVGVGILIQYEPLIEALPNAGSKTVCQDALRKLITEIGYPTPTGAAVAK